MAEIDALLSLDLHERSKTLKNNYGFRQHNWYELGEYIKIRALVEQKRASAKDVDGTELQ